jgi:radical SAM protein with 4Fe4S-binding SPASM domain
MFFTKEDEHLIPSNNDLSAFMIDLFNLWIDDKSEDLISIDPFTTIISSFWGENAGDCCYKSSCSSFFLIETDGTVTLCSRLKFLNHRFSSLAHHSWNDILKSEVIKKLNSRIKGPNHECANCLWLKACGCGYTASLNVNASVSISSSSLERRNWFAFSKGFYFHLQFHKSIV